MSKKGNLSAALSQFDKRPDPVPTIEQAPTATAPAVAPTQRPQVPQAEGQGSAKQPPSRKGKKALTGYFDPSVLKQLKVMGLEQDKTTQALMAEALNDLFKKYGKPHIA